MATVSMVSESITITDVQVEVKQALLELAKELRVTEAKLLKILLDVYRKHHDQTVVGATNHPSISGRSESQHVEVERGYTRFEPVVAAKIESGDLSSGKRQNLDGTEDLYHTNEPAFHANSAGNSKIYIKTNQKCEIQQNCSLSETNLMNTSADSITGMKLVKTELEDKEFVIVNTNMDDGDDENSIIVQHEIDLHRESGGAMVQDDGVATDKYKEDSNFSLHHFVQQATTSSSINALFDADILETNSIKLDLRETPYACTICGLYFTSRSNLCRHKYIHTGRKPHECSVCGKCFSQMSCLRVHKRIHTGEKPYKCLICDRSFSDYSVLSRHKRIHTGEVHTASGAKLYTCLTCGKSFKNQSSLSQHESTHTDGNSHGCSTCGKLFSHASSLAVHNRICKSYTCTSCGRHFSDYHVLSRHQLTHFGENTDSYATPDENVIKYASPDEMVHIPDTKEVFPSATLTNYTNMQSDESCECSICGKILVGRANLAAHLRTHTGVKPHQCATCGKSFNNRSSLSRHASTHTGQKPHACTTCGKCFSRPSCLTVHKRIHTGEKPFKCSTCGRCFSDLSVLSRHQRTHTGDKPYECLTCGYKFAHLHHLTSHQRRHDGDMQFECSICAMCFPTSYELSRHKRSHIQS